MTDVLIPPDIVPMSETAELMDDGTSVFKPQFAPIAPQRNQFYEPWLKITQSWKSLRLEDKARMMSVLGQLKGKYNTLRALTGFVRRGSFPGQELLSNNSFSSGTTGWTAASDGAISVSDRILRVRRAAVTTTNSQARANVTYTTQNRPYVARSLLQPGKGPTSFSTYIDDTVVSKKIDSAGTSVNAVVLTPAGSSSGLFAIYEGSSSGTLLNDYFSCPWTSVTQCLQVDNGVNQLTFSDQFDNAAWSKIGTTVSADVVAAPDGTITADALNEGSSGPAPHAAQRAVTVSSSTLFDYCFSCAIKANTRSWAQIFMDDGTSPVSDFINLSTGVLGVSGSTGGTWANRRTFVTDMGNGWYQVSIISRKTSASTSITVGIRVATGDGVSTYTGSNLQIYIWRGTMSQSSAPMRLTQTTSSALTSGTSQSGNTLYVKGGPPSASASLCSGDLVEINGELKQLTASLDLDASGLGYLQFAPALFRAPADNDAVVVGQPLGKFMLIDNPKWENQFGQYADLTLTFGHIYE